MLLLHADFLDGPLDTNIERLRYAGGWRSEAGAVGGIGNRGGGWPGALPAWASGHQQT